MCSVTVHFNKTLLVFFSDEKQQENFPSLEMLRCWETLHSCFQINYRFCCTWLMGLLWKEISLSHRISLHSHQDYLYTSDYMVPFQWIIVFFQCRSFSCFKWIWCTFSNKVFYLKSASASDTSFLYSSRCKSNSEMYFLPSFREDSFFKGLLMQHGVLLSVHLFRFSECYEMKFLFHRNENIFM